MAVPVYREPKNNEKTCELIENKSVYTKRVFSASGWADRDEASVQSEMYAIIAAPAAAMKLPEERISQN
jgi:hypothetical protein